jgi:uncharacterized YigZ family protein
MRTVAEPWRAETEAKRSRFLAFLVPHHDFPGLQERLKAEHPKASHVVYAWRHINEYDQIVENSSDDGEPKGCAGAPVLNVMRGAELVECALLVVRYFGGIKLGTGGMVRAYGAAARAVVEAAQLQPWERQHTRRFRCVYSHLRQVEYLLERHGLESLERTFEGEGPRWEIRGMRERLEAFFAEAKGLVHPE